MFSFHVISKHTPFSKLAKPSILLIIAKNPPSPACPASFSDLTQVSRRPVPSMSASISPSHGSVLSSAWIRFADDIMPFYYQMRFYHDGRSDMACPFPLIRFMLSTTTATEWPLLPASTSTLSPAKSSQIPESSGWSVIRLQILEASKFSLRMS